MAFTAQPGQSYSLQELQSAGGVPVANNSNANDLYANYVKNNVPGAFLPQSNQPNPVASIAENAGNGLMNYGKSVMGDINNDSADIAKQIQTPIANTQGPIDPATGLPQGNMGKGAVEKGFGIVGDALDAITSPIQEALKGALGPVTNALSNLGANKQTKANAQQAQAQISQYLQAHPELSQNLTTLNKIISSAGVIAGTDEAGQGLENAQDRINNPETVPDRVVQRVNMKSGPEIPETKEYMTIPKAQAQAIIDKIDNAGGQAITDEQGRSYHITAKTPEQMEAQGFTNAGNAKLDELPTNKMPQANPEAITPGQSSDSLKTAAEARFNPPTQPETELADKQGRTSMVNGKKVISTPTAEETAMNKALQPLVEKGQITTPKDFKTGLIKPEAQEANLGAVSDELDRQTSNVRTQAQASDKATGELHDEDYGNELKDKIDNLDRPTTIKSDTALQKRLDDFDDAVKEVIDKTSSKVDEATGQVGSGKIEGLLDDRQAVKQLMDNELPKAWESKTRADTALEAHAKDVYNLFNEEAKDNLPNGKLPDGTDWIKAGRTQSALMEAQDDMAYKYSREYKVGEGEFSRMVKAHPFAARIGNVLLRQLIHVPITMTEGEIGITQLERAAAKPK